MEVPSLTACVRLLSVYTEAVSFCLTTLDSVCEEAVLEEDACEEDAPEEGTSEEAASEEDTCAEVASEEDTSEEAALEEDTCEDVPSEETASGSQFSASGWLTEPSAVSAVPEDCFACIASFAAFRSAAEAAYSFTCCVVLWSAAAFAVQLRSTFTDLPFSSANQ